MSNDKTDVYRKEPLLLFFSLLSFSSCSSMPPSSRSINTGNRKIHNGRILLVFPRSQVSTSLDMQSWSRHTNYAERDSEKKRDESLKVFIHWSIDGLIGEEVKMWFSPPPRSSKLSDAFWKWWCAHSSPSRVHPRLCVCVCLCAPSFSLLSCWW